MILSGLTKYPHPQIRNLFRLGELKACAECRDIGTWFINQHVQHEDINYGPIMTQIQNNLLI